MITFRPFDYSSQSDCNIQAKWENDPSIRHLFCFFKDEPSSLIKITPQQIAHQKPSGHSRRRWMILWDEALVGEMGFSLDDEQLITKIPNTAWIGITIGEASARNRGVGIVAIKYLEDQLAQLGVQSIELGVFEFNEIAIRFYRKLGYQEIIRLPDFAYWNGKMWADIRMLKDLGFSHKLP